MHKAFLVIRTVFFGEKTHTERDPLNRAWG